MRIAFAVLATDSRPAFAERIDKSSIGSERSDYDGESRVCRARMPGVCLIQVMKTRSVRDIVERNAR